MQAFVRLTAWVCADFRIDKFNKCGNPLYVQEYVAKNSLKSLT